MEGRLSPRRLKGPLVATRGLFSTALRRLALPSNSDTPLSRQNLPLAYS